MGSEYPVLSVRMDAGMREGVASAAAREGLGSSKWVKELIVAALRSGASLSELCARLAAPVVPAVRPVQPLTVVQRGAARSPGGGGLGVVARSCLHPPHRVTHFATFSKCEACGDVVNVECDPDVTPRPLHAQAPAL